MWEIVKELKRKVKRRQNDLKGYMMGYWEYGKPFVHFTVLTTLGMLTSFAILVLISQPLFLFPLAAVVVIAGVIVSVVLWKLKLKPLHPLVRQIGSHEERKRKEALEKLLQMDNDAIPLFIQALNSPSESAPYGDWNGYWAHRLAVEGLGRLKAKSDTKVLIDAMKHEDPIIKALSVWALGEAGAVEATAELIPLLVYKADMYVYRETFESSVRSSAKEALEKLGKGKLVDALLQVLEREQDEAILEQIRCWLPQYRSAIVKMLLDALRGENTFAATQAAWALKNLNAFEALAVLERIAYSFFTPREVRKACQDAVSWLRMISNLPSPANLANVETENLPAIPDPKAIPTETLPRPALSPNEPKEVCNGKDLEHQQVS